MKTYKEEVKKVVDDVICDCCGQSTNTSGNTTHIYPSWAELGAMWGYGCINDGVQYDIDLCEQCFMSVVDFIKKKRKQTLGPFQYPHDHDPLKGKSYFP